MKILLLGDASNYHQTLAKGLRALGHDVTVASDGSQWMDTDRDIDLSRKEGRFGGLKLWLRLSLPLRRKLKGYDVVQIASTGFVKLRPERQLKLLKRLKKGNGAVYLTALGTDSAYVRDCTSAEPALAYSEWHDKKGLRNWAKQPAARKDQWLAPELVQYTDEVYRTVDGAVAALYEYYKVVEHQYPDVPLAYAGIPIDMAEAGAPAVHDFSAKLPVFIACHKGREAEKGADVLNLQMDIAGTSSPDRIEIKKFKKNLPYSEFLTALRENAIVVDQLYSYSPATTALLTMAMGGIPISGGEEEFYDFIGEKTLRPVFNPDPASMKQTYKHFMEMLSKPEELERMAKEGPEFVKRHNEMKVVAQRFVDFWNSRKN